MVAEGIRQNQEEQVDFEFQDNYLPEIDDLQVAGKKIVHSVATVVDQYATVCDIVISSVGHHILRIVDFFNTIPSFMDVISGYHLWIILSVLWTIVYTIFYIIALPGRIFVYILFKQPWIVIYILFVIVEISILKRVPVSEVYRRGSHYIWPFLWMIAYSLLIYLLPPLGAAIVAVNMFFAVPVTTLFNFISVLFYQLASLQSLLRKAQRDRRSRLSELDPSASLTDEQPSSERIQCCVCLDKVKSILLRPCNHVCVCSDCATVLLAEPAPHCPLCRAVIESQCNVYI